MKKRTWLWIAAAAAVLMSGALGYALTRPAASADSEGVLYRVQGEQGQAYLLGSIHIGTEDMYPFGTAIQSAMDEADTFVYECDTVSAEAVAGVRARMALPAGETLADAVGEESYAKLGDVCDRLGLSLASLDGLKPWAVINTLAIYATAAELGERDVSGALALGVEEQVQAYAEAGGKPVRYLETADEQTDVLVGFSDELKRYLLQTECDAILDPDGVTGMDASIQHWPEWWRTGDADAFAEQYESTYLAPGYEAVCAEYHQKLVVERNARMAVRLDGMLSEGGTYFVTVGLLHLVLPEDSVPAALSAMGYTVERISGE